jgi:hypothetical protein
MRDLETGQGDTGVLLAVGTHSSQAATTGDLIVRVVLDGWVRANLLLCEGVPNLDQAGASAPVCRRYG